MLKLQIYLMFLILISIVQLKNLFRNKFSQKTKSLNPYLPYSNLISPPLCLLIDAAAEFHFSLFFCQVNFRGSLQMSGLKSTLCYPQAEITCILIAQLPAVFSWPNQGSRETKRQFGVTKYLHSLLRRHPQGCTGHLRACTAVQARK